MPRPSRAARSRVSTSSTRSRPFSRGSAAPGAGELPFGVAAQGAEDGLVAGQIGRRARRAAAPEIGRAGHPQPPHMADRPRRQGGIGQRADAQCHIDALVDQVEVAVAQHQLDLHAVMGVEEARDDRRDVAAAELHRRGDAQQALHRRVGRTRGRGLVVGDQRPRPVVERAAGLAGRQPARRAIDQAEADAVLERSQRARDGGRRAAQAGAARTRLPSSTMRTKIASSSRRSMGLFQELED